jgi:hypothetical protein
MHKTDLSIEAFEKQMIMIMDCREEAENFKDIILLCENSGLLEKLTNIIIIYSENTHKGAVNYIKLNYIK